jgi:hypothetical protein
MINPIEQVKRELHSVSMHLAEVNEGLISMYQAGWYKSSDPDHQKAWLTALDEQKKLQTQRSELEAEIMRLLR